MQNTEFHKFFRKNFINFYWNVCEIPGNQLSNSDRGTSFVKIAYSGLGKRKVTQDLLESLTLVSTLQFFKCNIIELETIIYAYAIIGIIASKSFTFSVSGMHKETGC